MNSQQEQQLIERNAMLEKKLKIEAALERVRSRTMSMQKSEELKKVIQVVYNQFVYLNILVEHTGFIIDYQQRDDMHIWLADKHEVPSEITIPYFDSPHWNSFIEAKEKGIDFFANYLTFEEKNKFYKDLFSLFPVPDEVKEYYFNCPGLAISTVLLDSIGLYIENFSGSPYSDEENATLMRFGKVFQQTYTRFLDLQKAEEQTREAKMEAALERTRAQSMVMQHSSELDDTLRVFHEQVLLLGINSAFSFLWLPDEERDKHIFWAIWEENKNGLTIFKNKAINYPLDRNEPATKQCLIDWKADEPVVSYAVAPEGVKNYFIAWQELIDGVDTLAPEHFGDGLYYVEAFMKYGCFGVMTQIDLNQEEKKILGRFAIEFERTYTRFLDLQKAEAQSRESQIQLALERVRARTMAMQHSNELPEAANLLFQQLQALGMPAWSAGYCIWDDDKKAITLWMSSEAVLQPPFMAPLTQDPSFIHMLEAHQRGETFYVEEVGGEELVQHYKYMRTLPVVGEILDSIINAGHPLPVFQIFHCVYFSQGFLLFITYEPIPNAHDIIKSFGKVFDQTYTRFLDLQKAEAQTLRAKLDVVEIKAARKKAEDAFTELQATQKQLIQSEKMASLGELTAGIAHEIQNPLNFVNNFSEVNSELIKELKSEVIKGNMEEVTALADDIESNSEKINHHGKRADAIVKGMLQHSRSSSGVKEPTGINALCDEYLRLSYHGLRAKDKSFNVTIKTDFDETAGKINIIPQDMGRVILNLINNAFYAVQQKQKEAAAGSTTFEKWSTLYEPTVTLITKKLGDKILIYVKDNGNGIPQKVLDKIFQPFFTTKPTGEGTGLGLSLSYDIVTKGHGGELKVETKEGDGTEFIIQLSLKQNT